MQERLFVKSGGGKEMKNEKNTCMDCGTSLVGKKRYPVYSSRLKVIGYRCAECYEKSKTPEARKREEEISKLTKKVRQ